MNTNGKFYNPQEMNMNRIIKPYQEAFSGDPWYEASKCADTQQPQRCIGSLSRIAVSSTCNTCGNCPSKPAYEAEELLRRFDTIAKTRPTTWYVEEVENEVAIAAVAWAADPTRVSSEKYSDVPMMGSWLEKILPDKFVWLDEVFADKTVRPKGNLANFGTMCRGIMEQLDLSVVAYRTINPAMTRTAKRDFGKKAQVFERENNVPDRRDFVIITNEGK